jgi:hypothetical protein
MLPVRIRSLVDEKCEACNGRGNDRGNDRGGRYGATGGVSF